MEETPEANVPHDLLSLLSDKLNSDLSLYNDFAVKIKNKAPLKNFVEKLCGISLEKETENCTNALGVYLLDQHLHEKCVNFYAQMGLNVFGALSESFGREITSFQDADSLIIAAWKKEAEGILDSQRVQEWIKERDELQEKTKEYSPVKDFFIYIFGILLGIFGVFSVIMGFQFFDFFSILMAVFMGLPLSLFGWLTLIDLFKIPHNIEENRKRKQRIEELNELLKS